jgi:hypothetical protein
MYRKVEVQNPPLLPGGVPMWQQSKEFTYAQMTPIVAGRQSLLESISAHQNSSWCQQQVNGF